MCKWGELVFCGCPRSTPHEMGRNKRAIRGLSGPRGSNRGPQKPRTVTPTTVCTQEELFITIRLTLWLRVYNCARQGSFIGKWEVGLTRRSKIKLGARGNQRPVADNIWWVLMRRTQRLLFTVLGLSGHSQSDGTPSALFKDLQYTLAPPIVFEIN